jgi:hypothetical protein
MNSSVKGEGEEKDELKNTKMQLKEKIQRQGYNILIDAVEISDLKGIKMLFEFIHKDYIICSVGEVLISFKFNKWSYIQFLKF